MPSAPQKHNFISRQVIYSEEAQSWLTGLKYVHKCSMVVQPNQCSTIVLKTQGSQDCESKVQKK